MIGTIGVLLVYVPLSSQSESKMAGKGRRHLSFSDITSTSMFVSKDNIKFYFGAQRELDVEPGSGGEKLIRNEGGIKQTL